MKIHELKTWPSFFQAVFEGSKTFELRFDDRNFQVGDVLMLREYDNLNKSYTSRSIKCSVTYKLDSSEFCGIKEGFCIMGIRIFQDGLQ